MIKAGRSWPGPKRSRQAWLWRWSEKRWKANEFLIRWIIRVVPKIVQEKGKERGYKGGGGQLRIRWWWWEVEKWWTTVSGEEDKLGYGDGRMKRWKANEFLIRWIIRVVPKDKWQEKGKERGYKGGGGQLRIRWWWWEVEKWWSDGERGGKVNGKVDRGEGKERGSRQPSLPK
nr:hypothetical protein Iba_chr10dCG12810 [Ipomoea batatas]